MGPVETHLHTAETALRGGHAREGLHAAEAALQTEPQNGRALALLGLAYALMGDEFEARDALTRAEKAAPLDSHVRYHHYLALGKLGDVQGARAQLTYFSQLEPENVQARAALARLGGALMNLPPLPRPASAAVWYDGGGHALADAGEIAAEATGAEPPAGPDVVTCPECSLRTWKGWVCKHCGAPLPRV
jgi:tetratricopeptide (TPR) repeat protein